MAGNIIPAIATTNAIISGLIVLQALHLLRKSYSAMKLVHLQFKPNAPLATVGISSPNPSCGVCRDTYVHLQCDPAQTQLKTIVQAVLGEANGNGTGPRDVSVYEGQRLLMEPDWEDNEERTLQGLDVGRGKFLTIVDEDGEWGTIEVAIGVLP
jgi:ubiquitin-like 1-activating enzyme E1 B